MNYSRVTPHIIDLLIEMLGKDNVATRESEIAGNSSDEMPADEHHLPDVVVKPADSKSVSQLLEFADDQRIPVTPRGAGTGLSGGCVPLFGGIVLSTERMNSIIKIDTANFTAVAEPGVTLERLKLEVETKGLYYPIHLGEMTATVGGSVATNAGGTNAVKYGVTRHQVLGLEVVLPGGEIVSTGGEYVKCSTGYDMTQLITGSEGTLGLITKIVLKLSPIPSNKEVLFVPFDDLKGAVDAVPEILKLNIIPTGLEFMERDILEIVEKYMEAELPCHDHNSFLMVAMEGRSEDEITAYFAEVEEICRRHGSAEAMVPGGERARRKLTEAREKFYHALKKYAPMELIDAVVPRSEIAGFVKQVRQISGETGMPVIVYGHAGDGNVHLHPVCINMDESAWRQKLPAMMEQIYGACVSRGGAISGEHGIGMAKKPYLKIEMDAAKIDLMRRIKKAFDPNGILNPGKIFDLN